MALSSSMYAYRRWIVYADPRTASARGFDRTLPDCEPHGEIIVTAHPSCPPKVNVFCHAGTRSVKAEAVHFARVADAPGKTKAINPTCAAAQEKMKTVSSRLQIHREDTVFAY